jgi:hypothetical protein
LSYKIDEIRHLKGKERKEKEERKIASEARWLKQGG